MALCRGRVASRRYVVLRDHADSGALLAEMLELAVAIHNCLLKLVPKPRRAKNPNPKPSAHSQSRAHIYAHLVYVFL